MAERVITVFTNNTKISTDTFKRLCSELKDGGFSVSPDLSPNTELIVCIGGDGTFLKAVQHFDFPTAPFVGINTGHLGFFQEISPDGIASFIKSYKQGKYNIQHLKTVKAIVFAKDEQAEHTGLNEVVIRGDGSYPIHLNISIGGSFIERFSGDGILVATSAGSTAYNYSLGGAIVDPRLNVLQLTPIAPINSVAYRSFTSSLMLPSDLSLSVTPESEQDYDMIVYIDGIENKYKNVSRVNVYFAEKIVNLVRFESYDFWNKVKTKFLDSGTKKESNEQI